MDWLPIRAGVFSFFLKRVLACFNSELGLGFVCSDHNPRRLWITCLNCRWCGLSHKFNCLLQILESQYHWVILGVYLSVQCSIQGNSHYLYIFTSLSRLLFCFLACRAFSSSGWLPCGTFLLLLLLAQKDHKLQTRIKNQFSSIHKVYLQDLITQLKKNSMRRLKVFAYAYLFSVTLWLRS